MIYLVSAQNRAFEDESYQWISPQDALILLEKDLVWGLDTETTGFSPYLDRIKSIQIGNTIDQFYIDDSIDFRIFSEFFNNPNRLFVLQNAKFDLRFFFRLGIIVKKVFDTFLAEKLLWLGYPPGTHRMSLDALVKDHLKIEEVDKTIRGVVMREGHSIRAIDYGCTDVRWLIPLMEAQLIRLKEEGLLNAMTVENSFVIPLAYTEYCGVKLDVTRWKEKMSKDLISLKESEERLNTWVLEYNNPKYIEFDSDLFEGHIKRCKINWNSGKQVIPLFKELGFNLKVKDKETGLLKDSIEAKVIKPQSYKSTITPIYLEYTQAQKLCSTYGQNVLDQINHISKRIHTNFNQLGADTGRLSSGGKDKKSKVEYLNFQNFPRDSTTRSCFISEPGYDWVSCDYSGQESRIIADTTGDKAMIDLFNNGCGDIHSLVAKMAYPHIIQDCPIEDIAKNFKPQRQDAKGIEFAINYGGDDNTIFANSDGKVSKEEAKVIYDNYMKGFPGMKSYQDKQRKFVMENGYILLNHITGHKAYIYDFKDLQALKREFTQDFWAQYKLIPRNDEGKKQPRNYEEEIMCQKVKKYFMRKAASEKQAINYPCQGTGAVAFKTASVFFWRYLIQNDLVFKVKLCIPAHDEWNIETPENITEEVTKALLDCMKRGGELYCKKVQMPSDASIGKHWIH